MRYGWKINGSSTHCAWSKNNCGSHEMWFPRAPLVAPMLVGSGLRQSCQHSSLCGIVGIQCTLLAAVPLFCWHLSHTIACCFFAFLFSIFNPLLFYCCCVLLYLNVLFMFWTIVSFLIFIVLVLCFCSMNVAYSTFLGLSLFYFAILMLIYIYSSSFQLQCSYPNKLYCPI